MLTHPGYEKEDMPSYALSVMSPGTITSSNAVRMLYEPGLYDIYFLNQKWNP